MWENNFDCPTKVKYEWNDNTFWAENFAITRRLKNEAFYDPQNKSHILIYIDLILGSGVARNWSWGALGSNYAGKIFPEGKSVTIYVVQSSIGLGVRMPLPTLSPLGYASDLR